MAQKIAPPCKTKGKYLCYTEKVYWSYNRVVKAAVAAQMSNNNRHRQALLVVLVIGRRRKIRRRYVKDSASRSFFDWLCKFCSHRRRLAQAQALAVMRIKLPSKTNTMRLLKRTYKWVANLFSTSENNSYDKNEADPLNHICYVVSFYYGSIMLISPIEWTSH